MCASGLFCLRSKGAAEYIHRLPSSGDGRLPWGLLTPGPLAAPLAVEQDPEARDSPPAVMRGTGSPAGPCAGPGQARFPGVRGPAIFIQGKTK